MVNGEEWCLWKLVVWALQWSINPNTDIWTECARSNKSTASTVSDELWFLRQYCCNITSHGVNIQVQGAQQPPPPSLQFHQHSLSHFASSSRNVFFDVFTCLMRMLWWWSFAPRFVTDLQRGPRLPRPEIKVVVVPGAKDLQDPLHLLDVPLTQRTTWGTQETINHPILWKQMRPLLSITWWKHNKCVKWFLVLLIWWQPSCHCVQLYDLQPWFWCSNNVKNTFTS